jgi:hypothetical protein
MLTRKPTPSDVVAVDAEGNPYTRATRGRVAGIGDATGEIMRKGDRIRVRGRGAGRVRILLAPWTPDPIGVDFDDGSRGYAAPSACLCDGVDNA